MCVISRGLYWGFAVFIIFLSLYKVDFHKFSWNLILLFLSFYSSFSNNIIFQQTLTLGNVNSSPMSQLSQGMVFTGDELMTLTNLDTSGLTAPSIQVVCYIYQYTFFSIIMFSVQVCKFVWVGESLIQNRAYFHYLYIFHK